ncbi:MAG: protein-(glutamine-N5) methyltransferase, release factor-specific [Kordiimonas sp.]|nr:protein-(glutamine-N5) methyltransferase, release factor-specific [Kordiimonas sp.]
MAQTADQLLRSGAKRLDDAGIMPPRLDSSILLAHAMGIERQELLFSPTTDVGAAQAELFETYIIQRLKRMPISHILGEREFWSLPFKVTADTLAPRPDSETLVEAALEFAEQYHSLSAPLRILDLGTGTGCLLLALLSECENAQGVGVEKSKAALAVAAENARNLGLEERTKFIEADFMADMSWGQEFDIIVCNPPYIALDDRARLDPEVRDFEPDMALYGGEDGLSYYRSLGPVLSRCLGPQGRTFLEVGIGQSGPVMGMMTQAGAENIDVHQDLAMIDRCVSFAFLSNSE